MREQPESKPPENCTILNVTQATQKLEFKLKKKNLSPEEFANLSYQLSLIQDILNPEIPPDEFN